ncbi:MAG: hypothetical protein RLZZ387_577 [Chloroflexota bacterium]|jgi:hypothetical protein
MALVLRSALTWLPALLLAPIVAAELLFFAVRTGNLLSYPYPLDYGEGPLLAQVQVLRAGTPIWALYADPDAPPYAVVNYPPIYHLAALALSYVVDDETSGPLLAGRLVSLLATLGCVAALWLLSQSQKAESQQGVVNSSRQLRAPQSGFSVQRSAFSAQALIVLAFLGLPIVREWSAVMRVDMLGVCLGLWGLVLVRQAAAGGSVLWPALLLALSLFVKPSLLAAPAASLLWLLFRDWRRAIRLGLALGGIGGLTFALLQLASGGWFFTHVVTANANPIDWLLGADFWDRQLAILWPLFAAGALGAALGLIAPRRAGGAEQLLPVYYALFGAVVALGVGKVGAYLNYFLELYAGLVWLAAQTLNATQQTINEKRLSNHNVSLQRIFFIVYRLSFFLVPALVAASLLRYVPLWSETYLKPYGLIEGRSPARVAFGGYGVWQDLRREAEVLAALGRVNAALVDEVRAAGAPIFTDLPGIAAQAGQLARHQAFEHRQLHDVGLWDQRPLLRAMANGRVPLVVLDYLGNWLTPEMMTLITRRYAQDGSRGPYDLYRPVDSGAPAVMAFDLGAGLRVEGAALTRPGGAAYSGGELVALTLDLRSAETSACDTVPGGCEVAVTLVDAAGQPLTESVLPLLYGVLPPRDWASEAVQHMQPLALPPDLEPGAYALRVALRAGGADVTPLKDATRAAIPLDVGDLTGRYLGEGGYFVPAPLLEAWLRDGDYDGPGDPITPAVPFKGFTAQCFQRACYRLAEGAVERVALGSLLSLAETDLLTFDSSDNGINPLMDYYDTTGRSAAYGELVGFTRGPREVLYTTYARIERSPEGEVRAANVGEAYLRLPGGVPYRWP